MTPGARCSQFKEFITVNTYQTKNDFVTIQKIVSDRHRRQIYILQNRPESSDYQAYMKLIKSVKFWSSSPSHRIDQHCRSFHTGVKPHSHCGRARAWTHAEPRAYVYDHAHVWTSVDACRCSCTQ